MLNRRELPPTAGLPQGFADYVSEPVLSLGEGLRRWLSIADPILTSSGSAALAVALTTLRDLVPQRSEVIVPAYTCPLVPLAVSLVPGLRVVVCDTFAQGFDFDPQMLAQLCGERTLAVLPTHLGGRVADVAAAIAIAHPRGVWVIEDAAQAMGALDNGVSAGLAGDIGFFSLAMGKGLTSGEGGILFSKDHTLRAALETSADALLKPAFFRNLRRNLELLGYMIMYRPNRLWHVYGRRLVSALDAGDPVKAVGDYFTRQDIPLHRLDALRTRVAANALSRLPDYLKKSRERAAQRLDILCSLPGLQVVRDRPNAQGIWPFFMVLFPGGEQRDRALTVLWRAGYGVTRLFIHALPDYDFLAPFLDPCLCPNARDFAGRMLTITNSHWLSEADFRAVVAAIRNCL
jgi:dTDP-4-amino-4,6-dideoxygalactose transaminase